MKFTLFIPEWVKSASIRSPFGDGEVVRIPDEEFADPDFMVEVEHFPRKQACLNPGPNGRRCCECATCHPTPVREWSSGPEVIKFCPQHGRTDQVGIYCNKPMGTRLVCGEELFVWEQEPPR